MHLSSIVFLVHRCHGDILDRGLEFDQRVRPVMVIDRASFAIGTKVRIIAHGTLVPIPDDVRPSIFVLTERPIAIDTVVFPAESYGSFDRFVDGYEAVSWVYVASIRDALRAVIPVRAVEALVTNSIDRLRRCSQLNAILTLRGDGE